MFYEVFDALCKQKGESPNAVAKKLYVASGTVTEWKKGRIPRNSTLIKIANYFGVSTDYLLGKESNPTENIESEQIPNSIRIVGRDGTYITKKLTDEQIAMLKTMIESLPEDDGV